MQKLIIIRGHSGSGKSTFAQQKISEFKAEYPDAYVYHIENDKYLIKGGQYHWTPFHFKQAKQQAEQELKEAFQFAKNHQDVDVLIVISNVGAKANVIRGFINKAKKQDMQSEVYRMQNFFPNVHNVDKIQVYSMFIEICQRSIAEEILVPAVQPMTEEDKGVIDKMRAFSAKNLPKNEQYNSYVTLDYLQFMRSKKTFTAKVSRLYPELTVLKYSRETFYNNQWDLALLEMRGLVMDAYGHLIVRPFKKCFNYSERKEQNSKFPLRLGDDAQVKAVVKVNGFLGCCTYVELPADHPSYQAEFDRKVIFSTTGSLDSDFAKLVEKHCAKHELLFKTYPNKTFLFEVCDESDPHIIKEILGETLIGCVDVKTGEQYSEQWLDEIALQYQLKRPLTLPTMTFAELKAELSKVKHEGFMVFSSEDELLFKLKSPYYLISKLLGRSSEENLAGRLDKRKVSEEYFPLIEHIQENKTMFNALDEQQKIQYVQDFLAHI